jgi:hypothetical protein
MLPHGNDCYHLARMPSTTTAPRPRQYRPATRSASSCGRWAADPPTRIGLVRKLNSLTTSWPPGDIRNFMKRGWLGARARVYRATCRDRPSEPPRPTPVRARLCARRGSLLRLKLAAGHVVSTTPPKDPAPSGYRPRKALPMSHPDVAVDEDGAHRNRE